MRGLPIAALSVVLMALGPASALADVVMPRPDDCIEGTRAATGHGGPRCAPLSCSADADCKGGTVCRELPLCVGVVHGGGRRPPGVKRPTYKTVVARCDKADGSSCALPEGASPRRRGVSTGTCQALEICVAAPKPVEKPAPSETPAETPAKTPADKPAPEKPQAKKGCVGSGLRPGLPLALLALCGVWFLRRRA